MHDLHASRRAARPLAGGLLGAIVLLACGGSASKADAPQLEPHDTGKSCAPATFACEPGRCAATIDNQCETPVTCQLKIVSQCQNVGGDTGPANASTKQVTQLAKTKNELEAATHCGQGTPILTSIESLTCF